MIKRLLIYSQKVHIIVTEASSLSYRIQGNQSRIINVNANCFILQKYPRDPQQVEVFGQQIYQRKFHILSEAYERATTMPTGYLVVDLYQQHQIVIGLEQTYDIVPTISPIIYSFKRTNYIESAELQAMHNSRKQMDTLMAHYDLPSEIKAQDIEKAQDRYLLFWKRLKSDQSFKSKGILEPERSSSPESLISVADNMESHDVPLDVGQSSELPPGIPDFELTRLIMERITLQRGDSKAHFTSYATSSISYGDFRKCTMV